jgi:hypothetical protein
MTRIPRHKTFRSALFVFAAAAIASIGQVALAAQPDPRITGTGTGAAAGDANNAAIEDVGAVAVNYSGQIAAGTIKLSTTNVQALTKVLSDAILAKTTGDGGVLTDPNRADNKEDEIGESAALVMKGIAASSKFLKAVPGIRTPNNLTLNLLKGALLSAKTNTQVIGANLLETVVRDVVGSVMLTIKNDVSINDKKDKKIYAFLKLNAKKVAGAANKNAVKAGLEIGYKGSTTFFPEDGAAGPIIDPETDTRNG